jgi:outer membrane protein, heavy metal efflux system
MRTIAIPFILLFVCGLGRAQDLQTLIQEAVDNNPQIKAYALRHTIAQEKVNAVQALPNTQVGAGYFVSGPETRTGEQRARFSIVQMLPWFGTVTARSSYASAMAESEFVEIAIAQRKLALSVAQSYYTLYALKARQEVLQENILLLATYERLALTSVAVGKASAVDILRLQIRQNELQQAREVLQEAFKAERTNLNAMLNRDAHTEVSVPQQMGLPLEDPVVRDTALALNPELLKLDKLYESVARSELLNQKESAPNIGFGLDYVPVAERPNMDFMDNGKDIFMPMVSLSIPIFNKSYASVSKQNELRQQEITSQKTERFNTLQTALAKAISERKQARITYNTQQKNLAQAQDAEGILIKTYETGTIDFMDVLDIQELQLKFQTTAIASVQQYFVQSALINYLTDQ